MRARHFLSWDPRPAVWLTWAVLLPAASAVEDWPQFRGADGQAASESQPPLQWDDQRNLAWKTPLPGAGASSPAIWRDRIYLTAYSGYGLDPDAPGLRDDLRLHVLALSRESGELLWDDSFPASNREQDASRRVVEHGYATPTVAANETGVYAYFGVSGLAGYDHQGRQRWKVSVGDKTAGFGTAASPILYRNLVIINASIEGGAVVAVDQASGEVAWRLPEVRRSWSTPAIGRSESGREELIVNHQDEIWGVDPANGQVLWNCAGIEDYIVPAPVVWRGVAYCLGGRSNRCVAVRLGGAGDVSQTHRLWESKLGANVTSPIVHQGRLYWASDRGIAHCLDLETGEKVYSQRLPTKERLYASMVRGRDRLYVSTRENGVVVLAAGPEYRELARNRLSDPGMLNATPAIADGRLYLRTNSALYCLREAPAP